MDMCLCVAEALCCSPETITALLIGYINTKKTREKKWNQVEELQLLIQVSPHHPILLPGVNHVF